MTFKSLLPPNSTPFERAMERVSARIENVPVNIIRTLCNPNTCPLPLLPYLAWEKSVDVWDASWPENRQRAAIKNSFPLHKRKGTVKAVKDAVAAIGGTVVLREWFEMEPLGNPGSFQAIIATGGSTVTEEFQQQLIAAITRSKPLSRHFTVGTGIDFVSEIGVVSVLQVAKYVRLQFTANF